MTGHLIANETRNSEKEIHKQHEMALTNCNDNTRPLTSAKAIASLLTMCCRQSALKS